MGQTLEPAGIRCLTETLRQIEVAAAKLENYSRSCRQLGGASPADMYDEAAIVLRESAQQINNFLMEYGYGE